MVNILFPGAVNFNSFHGCLKCTIVGKHHKDLRTNVFPIAKAPSRTDFGYRNRIYKGHHQTYRTREEGRVIDIFVETPLLRLPIDMVEDIIVGDSLHLLLGITKKLLTLYKDGQIYHKKWSPETINSIDKILNTIRLPLEIQRHFRGLNYLCRWKASECGSFLNYVGIVILEAFLDDEHFQNFANLFCAVTISSSD